MKTSTGDLSIWAAYADADMTTRCPHCGAEPNIFCSNIITGRVRRTPCIARIASKREVGA